MLRKNLMMPVVKWMLLCSVFVTTLMGADPEGIWSFRHASVGELFVIIKSDGSCSYFPAKGMETQIKKGTWSEEEGSLRLVFENGAIAGFVLTAEEQADLRFEFGGNHGLGTEAMVANRVPQSQVGRLTVDPSSTRKTDESTEEDSFIGFWEGELLSGDKFHFVIDQNRTAGSTHSFSGTEQQLVVGFWRKDGPEMFVYWSDGAFSIIKRVGRRVEQTTMQAGEFLESAKGYSCRVISVGEKDIPEEWHQKYRVDFVARTAFMVFRKRSQVRDFFRGDWYVGASRDESSMIRFGRMGRASTGRYGGVKGEWMLDTDAAVIRWRNGVREWVRPIGRGFVINSYNPDQPLQGRPARIELIHPDRAEKVQDYNNRKQQMMGLGSIPTPQ